MSAVVDFASYEHPGTYAQSARPLHHIVSSTEALRDLNVGNIGLRGVRLATHGRDLDVVPVVHMPDRDPGNAREVAPPPSLDLLGLDPVPPVPISGGSQMVGDLNVGPNPFMPGVATPFSRVSEPLLGVHMAPPPPPGGASSVAAATYTPGGTRVPDGTPPVTLERRLHSAQRYSIRRGEQIYLFWSR